MGSGGGIAVEVVGGQEADGGMVVVAGHAAQVEAAQAGYAGSGVGAVAHDVAQAPHLAEGVPLLGVAEDGLQRLQVGMNVGDDGNTHSAHSISPATSGLHSPWCFKTYARSCSAHPSTSSGRAVCSACASPLMVSLSNHERLEAV